MKSVDPGILSKSECFTFQPSEIAAKTMKHLTWCGHYFCTNSYFMERETYPYVPVIADFPTKPRNLTKFFGRNKFARNFIFMRHADWQPRRHDFSGSTNFARSRFNSGGRHAADAETFDAFRHTYAANPFRRELQGGSLRKNFATTFGGRIGCGRE